MNATNGQVLNGVVVDGMGIGAKKVALLMAGLVKCPAVAGLEGIVFFPGTLNVQLEHDWPTPETGGVRVGKEVYGGDGDVLLFPCVLEVGNKKAECFIVRPEKTSHPDGLVEVVAALGLREYLQATTGSTLSIHFSL